MIRRSNENRDCESRTSSRSLGSGDPCGLRSVQDAFRTGLAHNARVALPRGVLVAVGADNASGFPPSIVPLHGLWFYDLNLSRDQYPKWHIVNEWMRETREILDIEEARNR